MNADQVPDRTRAASSAEGPRRTYWRIGGILLGLVILILAGAIVLDRQLRPTVGIEPVSPAAQVTAAPTGHAPAPATAGPTPATAESPPATGTERTPLPTTAGLQPTEAVVPGPSGPGESAVAGEEVVQAWRSTGSPLEVEVEAAYLRFWQVRRAAYLALDESRMLEVAAGPQLAREQENIRELRAGGRAARLDVEHSSPIAFIELEPERAVVYDEYVDRSRLLDLTTKREVGTAGPADVEKLSFRMERIDGTTWKVVDSARHP